MSFWRNKIRPGKTVVGGGNDYSKTIMLVGFSFILAFFFNAGILIAQESAPAQTQQNVPAGAQDADAREKAIKRALFLKSLKEQLASSNAEFKQVSDTVDKATVRLGELKGRVDSLTNQLANLDEQIAISKALIENVTRQIGEKEAAIIKLYDELDIKKAAIEEQKLLLAEYLNALYEQENSVTDTMTDNEEISITKLLLSDVPIGEQLQQIKYFNIMESTGHEIFQKLEDLYLEQLVSQRQIEIQKSGLEELKQRLDEENINLQTEYDSKMRIVAVTKGQEILYQKLLGESAQQQDELEADLKTLRMNLAFIEEKIRTLGDKFNPDDFASILGKEITSVADYIRKTQDNENAFNPAWPVSPSRGISAYYHDANYVKVFGFTHNAIDIRVPQGTQIKAPADGVVYKVRDNGYGYSYLILAHEGGFMTVYGHVTEFLVQPGEKVMQGEVVAKSGGIPGSKGAGLMTTGAHLHFEVLKNGKYVDPLDYMNISMLPVSTLPEKYATRLTGEDRRIKREGQIDLSAGNDKELLQLVESNASVDKAVYGDWSKTQEIQN